MDIQNMVIVLIGILIMFSVVVIIMGNISQSFDCEQLPGFAENATGDAQYPSGTWAGICNTNNENSVNSFNLVIIVAIIVSAAIILGAVRYLTSG